MIVDHVLSFRRHSRHDVTTVSLPPMFASLPSLLNVAQFDVVVLHSPSYSPFYILAEAYRAILLYHHAPNLIGLGYVSILGIAMASLMLRYFHRLKGYFESAF